MQIFLSNIECPDCHGCNCVKNVGRFCGVIYGCADCNNTWPSSLSTLATTDGPPVVVPSNSINAMDKQ